MFTRGIIRGSGTRTTERIGPPRRATEILIVSNRCAIGETAERTVFRMPIVVEAWAHGQEAEDGEDEVGGTLIHDCELTIYASR